MLSKNLTVFAVICSVFFTAILFGLFRDQPADAHGPTAGKPAIKKDDNIPDIGKIQVLNGYGGSGGADEVTDLLRADKFDVKNKGNAQSYNYPFTLVVSRIKDMTIARKVAGALKTDRLVLVRNEDPAYDVTVIIGRDYKERIK
jgi:hypothetical protein